MTAPEGVTTRGARVRYLRMALATKLGNVSLARFGVLVASEMRQKSKPFHASSVKAWEAGGDLSQPVARAVAAVAWRNGLKWVTPRWVLFGGDEWGDEGPPDPVLPVGEPQPRDEEAAPTRVAAGKGKAKKAAGAGPGSRRHSR